MSRRRTRSAFAPNLDGLSLEERISPAIVVATDVIKVPGPTDTVVTTATNPAGNQVPGQSDVETLSNREARHL